MWRVPLSDIAYDAAERQAVLGVLESRWLSMGESVRVFEERYAAMAGTRHAVALANCTAALHLALLGLDIGPGDEVVCPSITFVAGANTVLAVGAVPVFADIHAPDTPTVDSRAIERCLTTRTKAIQVMHYAGFVCDMEPIMALAAERGIPVVEDCAHSLTAHPQCGIAGCHSFFPNKNMTTGEGGMLTTNDDALAARVRKMRSHGMTTLTWDRHKGHAFSYDVDSFGLNYRMDELRAALGLAQLGKLEDLNARRAALAAQYRDRLAGVDGVELPFAGRDKGSWHIFPVLVQAASRRGLMEALREAGVQTSIHYPPAHRFSLYRELFPEAPALPLAEEFGNRELTLPLHPGMRGEDVAYVCEAIGRALDKGETA
ncbi:MAG: DegT/DnrJ/EryC1/StrS family aminotransferase [Desulfovibrionaceae bacterium]